MKPKLLDLFCGLGGASLGYAQAGFEVVGVDIVPQKHYPFEFVQADALQLPILIEKFDLVHASPPCQAFTGFNTPNKRNNHPNLIPQVRGILVNSGKPFVIENTPKAPLKDPIILCGSMFNIKLKIAGGELRRHRCFETSFPVQQLLCNHELRAITVTSRAGGYSRKANRPSFTLEQRRRAMGIFWGLEYGMSQAIPPAYTKYIGEQFLRGTNT